MARLYWTFALNACKLDLLGLLHALYLNAKILNWRFSEITGSKVYTPVHNLS